MSTELLLDEVYDDVVVEAANRAAETAINEFVADRRPHRATAVTAPAGAGKTELVVGAVGAARRKGLRIAVCAPTNEQVFGLVRRLAMRHRREVFSFLHASAITLPRETAQLPNVRQVDTHQANHAAVVVGTVSKLGDAFSRGDLLGFDALVIDEAYQADSSRYYAIGDLAPRHLPVGDGGQLSPFSTIENPERWRGLPEDPLQTAVDVLLRNHPSTTVHRLPASRRLDGRAIPVVQNFYPDLRFNAVVRPEVRQLTLLHAVAKCQRDRALDKVLDYASVSGWAHVELPNAPALTADPQVADLISALIERLLQRAPRVRCEQHRESAALPHNRLAIAVSHNDQKDLLRAQIDAAGHHEVVVDTANKLQGLEFDVTIAWHPLAGLPEPDSFHLEPGRLGVMLTRHRHACIVVGRAGDSGLLEGIPPSAPAYLGWDRDPLLDGWQIHRDVFAALAQHRFAM